MNIGIRKTILSLFTLLVIISTTLIFYRTQSFYKSLARGNKYFEEGRYHEALPFLISAFKRSPDNMTAARLLLWSYEKLLLELDRTLPPVKFSRDRIARVSANLLNNAIKYTEKGRILISTKRVKNTVRVSVSDTGPGIRGEEISKLFHPFEQLEKGKDNGTGGTGLGLAISKEIIIRHKGKIWAESEPGKGTTFHFVLPIMERRG